MPRYGIVVSTHTHYELDISADDLDSAIALARSLDTDQLSQATDVVSYTKNISAFADLDSTPVEWSYCDL